ncbi:MAG: DUF1203 domain-containing protein [Arenimonas sp.]|jgi:hypothetical protein
MDKIGKQESDIDWPSESVLFSNTTKQEMEMTTLADRVAVATRLRIRGIPTEGVSRMRRGEPDANDQPALEQVAEGLTNPCRHCLGLIAEGDKKLILAYRPFNVLQPYAETGPIFLHGEPCERYDCEVLPAWFDHLDPAIVRGYGADDWIRYDTGRVVPGRELMAACQAILSDATVAYVHIRSRYNCFQCRVERG